MVAHLRAPGARSVWNAEHDRCACNVESMTLYVRYSTSYVREERTITVEFPHSIHRSAHHGHGTAVCIELI